MTSHPATPLEFHQDLTASRLDVLAQIIRQEIARAHAKFAGEPKVGWSRGCTVYEAVMNAIEVLALSGAASWLRFKQERGKAYSLRIGEVAIRVQRFDDEPKPLMDGEEAQAATVATQVPFPFGMNTLAGCLVRMEFDVVGDRVECHLRVWSRNVLAPVLYHSWQLGNAESTASMNVSSMPKAEPAKQAPAAFQVDGVDADDAEHDNDKSDVG